MQTVPINFTDIWSKNYSNPFLRQILQGNELAWDLNDWKSTTHLFRWEDGNWTCRIDLEPGTYQYQIMVDGVRVVDPNNSETGYAKGKHYSVLKVK